MAAAAWLRTATRTTTTSVLETCDASGPGDPRATNRSTLISDQCCVISERVTAAADMVGS